MVPELLGKNWMEKSERNLVLSRFDVVLIPLNREINVISFEYVETIVTIFRFEVQKILSV